MSRTLDHQGFLRTILISAIMRDGKGTCRVLGSGLWWVRFGLLVS